MKPILAQPAARAAAAIIATAAAALLAAACSGTPPSTHSGAATNTASSAASKDRAYASCMRSHGVANFPDPGSGGFDKATLAQLAASNSQYRAASQTCGHLLPAGSSRRTPAEERQEWSGMLKFARCMRSHGVASWPDPTPYPPYPSDPTYNLPASIQPGSQIISKFEQCLRLVPMNYALGHIDNNNWQSAQQQMAGL